jgi:Rrf2 family transcriptional regulator, cysteine metabolism repressor
MTLMSRKVDYALLILSFLDQKREGGCAREIADRFGLSKGFVANILKSLCQEGFVASHRGVKGGYVLLRPAEEVSLAELMEALDDSFHLAECTRTPESELCTLSAVCPVRGAIADVHHRIREMLRGVTLAEIIRPRGETGATVLGLELMGTR